jgi:hypothetical protein
MTITPLGIGIEQEQSAVNLEMTAASAISF